MPLFPDPSDPGVLRRVIRQYRRFRRDQTPNSPPATRMNRGLALQLAWQHRDEKVS